MKIRLGIRYLLLAANALILLMPVFAVVFFHLWEGHLVRLTEQQLTAEATLIGEAWRERLAEEGGTTLAGATPSRTAPAEPQLPLRYRLEPPAAEVGRLVTPADTAEWRAGESVTPLLQRAARANPSRVRILDRRGCVIATAQDDLGVCLDHLPEVARALAGDYAAAARQPDEPRRSQRRPIAVDRRVRVSTANPVFDGDHVLGVVLLSRASDSPLEVFWRLRYTVLAAVLLCLAATAVVSAFLSRVISRPVVEITGAAEAVARGEPLRSFRTSRLGPAEVNALGEALDRMTRQLTDRASYISQFATNLTHELKTPLTGIRGAVELLREDWGEMSQEQRRRFLDNIDADAARMERLATRLLQLARIQSSPETAEPIVVAPFFREVLRRYDGRVRLDVAVAPAEVVINPDHLETAVRNLVDNALRHGGDAPVDVVVRRSAGRLAVDVRDRGPGISQGNRARIFERFFTTQRDQGGTGLGLSIVRAVADTRGGRISFESGPTGTCFTLVV
jgi:signal transduction histidine kinase